MEIRYPAVAGAFYPGSSSELKRSIEKFLSQAKGERKSVIAAVVPHAGYSYCGKTAASVYKTIDVKFDTAVILGPNHYGSGMVSTASGIWQTPLGNAKTDESFVKELTKDSIIVEDARAHLREHSIEVQLPWLQYLFEDFQFVPISINPNFFDVKTCREVGEKIAEAAKSLKRKILVIASSDFTHHGSMYGYAPFKGNASQVLKKIKETDLEIAGYISKLMPERLIESCEDKTVCGYGAIASAIWAAKALGAKKGEVLDYSTSYEVSRDTSAIVGYCGIILI